MRTPRYTFAASIGFAAIHHAGDTYGGYNGRPDQPYIFHLMRVAERVPAACRNVAVLHDVGEDHGVMPPPWLEPVEVQALDLLTCPDGKSYEAYIERIRFAEGPAGVLAREIKVADLRDNLSHDPPERLRRRYVRALRELGAEVRDP